MTPWRFTALALLLLICLAARVGAAEASRPGDSDWNSYWAGRQVDENAARWLAASPDPSGSGFMMTRLKRDWSWETTDLSSAWLTCVSQSRVIGTLSKGYALETNPAKRQQYYNQIVKASDFLLSQYPYDGGSGNPGGFVLGFFADHRAGLPPARPAGTSDPYWPHDNISGKDTVGLSQVIHGLTSAWRVTGDARYLNGAKEATATIRDHMYDSHGGLISGTSRDFSQYWTSSSSARYSSDPANASRGLSPIQHTFEAMIQAYALTPQPEFRQEASRIGQFITANLFRPHATNSAWGFVPQDFDNTWTPTSTAVKSGTNMEIAYMLSRAVELGIVQGSQAQQWLTTSRQIVDFIIAANYDAAHGGFYGTCDFDGLHAADDATKTSAWTQIESLRTLAYFAALRGDDELWPKFDASLALMQEGFFDNVNGGVNWDGYNRPGTGRGSWWGGGYHETMLYDEMLRLSSVPEPAALGLLVLAAMGLRRRH